MHAEEASPASSSGPNWISSLGWLRVRSRRRAVRGSGGMVRVFDAVCFEKCVAGGRGCVRGKFSNSATDQKRARCPTPAFVEINEQSPRLKITSSPAAASVAPPHFPVDINAASTAQRGLAWTKNSLNRQLPIFKLAFSARLRAFRVRSSSPVGWNPPSTLTARRGPSAPQPSSAARRRILDETLWHTGQKQK